MQMCQSRSHFGQSHLTWSELVTGGTTELLEALSPSPLRGRALILRHLGDNAHRLQRGNASFKPLCPFLALGREAKLALTADGVALLATVSVEKVLGELALTLASRDHPVQCGAGRSRGLLAGGLLNARSFLGRRRAAAQTQNQYCHNAATEQNDELTIHRVLTSSAIERRPWPACSPQSAVSR